MIASTTNQIEGAINSPMRELLKRHRGLSEHHQKRALEWWLHTRHPTTGPPTDILHARQDPAPADPQDDEHDDPDTPALYDTGLHAEEGLWLRSGWAGKG